MMAYRFVFFAVSTAMLLLSSCTKQQAEVALSDKEIIVVPSLEESKATMIAAGDLTSNRIHLDGYIHGTTTKHLDGNILFDGKWMFYTTGKNAKQDVHYYWPQKSSLDILAYSPAKLDNTCIDIISSTEIKCSNLPMTYTDQKGTKLNEFIVGYKANCTKDESAVSITLKRPYAAVKLYLDEAVRSRLNYIRINDLYSTGTFSSDASGNFTWSDLKDKSDLYLELNKNYPSEEINNGTLLTIEPFLVIPQTLENIKLRFSYRSVGNTYDTITEASIGKSLAVGIDDPVSSWEPGKIYNYFITLNGAANEIRMAVKVEPWKIEGSSVTEVK